MDYVINDLDGQEIIETFYEKKNYKKNKSTKIQDSESH